MQDPIVYMPQKSLPSAWKPLHKMKCCELMESLKTKSFSFPEDGLLKFQLASFKFLDYTDAWKRLEESLQAGKTRFCLEVAFENGFYEKDPRFLTVRKLGNFLK
jgi:hypothetical protein